MKPLYLPLLALLALPAMAETPVQNRIDFQTEVETVVSNDLMTATLSLETNHKSPAALARELNAKTQ